MIIIKGRISTTEGPVPVEELKAGMLVIDRGHRMREVVSVTAKTVPGTVRFKRSGTEVSMDALINSVYGPRGFLSKGIVKKATNPMRISGEGDRVLVDEFSVGKASKTGYEIVLKDSRTLFVDGYSFDIGGDTIA